ncbi:hypothetical protein CKO33_03355 [Ectothiorhodospira mobilis]|nr:hypothetical protein [Ectothiorhodospira mobilis]
MQDANVYLDGTNNLIGRAGEVTLPEISPAMSEHSGLGMLGTLELPAGLEALSMSTKWTGFYADHLRAGATPFRAHQFQICASQAHRGLIDHDRHQEDRSAGDHPGRRPQGRHPQGQGPRPADRLAHGRGHQRAHEDRLRPDRRAGHRGRQAADHRGRGGHGPWRRAQAPGRSHGKRRLVTRHHLAQLKAEGVVGHADLMEMSWDDVLGELEDYADYVRRKNEAMKAGQR